MQILVILLIISYLLAAWGAVAWGVIFGGAFAHMVVRGYWPQHRMHLQKLFKAATLIEAGLIFVAVMLTVLTLPLLTQTPGTLP